MLSHMLIYPPKYFNIRIQSIHSINIWLHNILPSCGMTHILVGSPQEINHTQKMYIFEFKINISLLWKFPHVWWNNPNNTYEVGFGSWLSVRIVYLAIWQTQPQVSLPLAWFHTLVSSLTQPTVSTHVHFLLITSCHLTRLTARNFPVVSTQNIYFLFSILYNWNNNL